MLQQVEAEVQPRLAAQVNTAVSLDRTRMVNTWYHILSSLLLLLTYFEVYDKSTFHTHVVTPLQNITRWAGRGLGQAPSARPGSTPTPRVGPTRKKCWI